MKFKAFTVFWPFTVTCRDLIVIDVKFRHVRFRHEFASELAEEDLGPLMRFQLCLQRARLCKVRDLIIESGRIVAEPTKGRKPPASYVIGGASTTSGERDVIKSISKNAIAFETIRFWQIAKTIIDSSKWSLNGTIESTKVSALSMRMRLLVIRLKAFAIASPVRPLPMIA